MSQNKPDKLKATVKVPSDREGDLTTFKEKTKQKKKKPQQIVRVVLCL